MLTLKQLASLTPPSVVKRATSPGVIILSDKEEADKKQKGRKYRSVYMSVALYNEQSSHRPYTLSIRNYGTKTAPENFAWKPESQIWVHCSCPYFTYYLEVALKLKGSSDIYDSNGARPRITNPTLRPYLCKHLVAALDYLAYRQKTKRK